MKDFRLLLLLDALMLTGFILSGCVAGTYHAQGTIIGLEVTAEPPGFVFGYRNFDGAFVQEGGTASTRTETTATTGGTSVIQESTYGKEVVE